MEFGHSFMHEDLGSGREYQLWIALLGVSRQLWQLNDKLAVDLAAEFHYGDVHTSRHTPNDMDIALNVAAEAQWKISQTIRVHASIGSGPGYFSAQSTKQVTGFVFSNNFVLGTRIAISSGKLDINPQVRFRHMSNAGIKHPNNGIDNFLLMIGVAVPLHRTH